MVEKKNNFFKFLFCLILAVILPFSFVGCKDKSTPEDIPPSNQGEPPNNNPDNADDNDDQTLNDNNDSGADLDYALTIEEMLTILNGSESKINEFLNKMNESRLFENVNSDEFSKFITCTQSAIKRAYYPFYLSSEFPDECSTSLVDFELNKVYKYNSGGVNNYIEFLTEQNRIIINCTSQDNGSGINKFTYFCFDFTVNGDEIESLKSSYFYNDLSGNNISFINATFDFSNLELTTEYGHISSYFEEPSEFLETYFKPDKFLEISNWTYTYYLKIQFGDTKQITLKKDEDARNEINNNINNLGFLNAFDKYSEFEGYDNLSISGITHDFVEYLEYGSLFKIEYENYCFTKVKK